MLKTEKCRLPAPSDRAAAVLAELARLRSATTLCPGELARRLGTTQRALRGTLAELEARGALVVSQRGVVKPLRDVRGPYRVARLRRGGG